MPSSLRLRRTRGKVVRRSKRRLRWGPSMRRRRRGGGDEFVDKIGTAVNTLAESIKKGQCRYDILGSGAEGIVYKVCVDDSFVAVKTAVIKQDAHETLRVYAAQKEGIFMKTLKHPNIVNVLYGPTYIHGMVCTALEYCEKSLEDKIKTSNTTNWPLILRLDVLIQIATGMQYLVNHGIAHRDLKPANVLLATQGAREVVKIADFGFHTSFSIPRRKLTANIGTFAYMAPDVMDSDTYNPVLIDIYSFGILMWWVLSGSKEGPFMKEFIDQNLDVLHYKNKIRNGEYGRNFFFKNQFRPDPKTVAEFWHGNKLITPIIKIMKKCWTQDPKYRYQSFDDVKSKLLQLFFLRY